MINNQCSMISEVAIHKLSINYNLELRTVRLAEQIIQTMRTISITAINKRIIEQLVGSAGSIGANYCEAVESESRKDFIHKVSIAKKETKETLHWLRLLAQTNPEIKDALRIYWKETNELLLIFSASVRTCRKSMNSLK